MLSHYFPNASKLVYGCMGLGGDWDSSPVTREHYTQARDVIETALENNITVFDHADIYTLTKAEQVFGQVLKDAPSLKEKMILQSKCAIRFEDEAGPKRYDFSAKWITESVDGILSRLGIEQLDILLLHRPDPLIELSEVAQTIHDLQASGKIKHLGVSNMHGHQIAFLQSALDTPIVANQLEMSLAFRDWVEDGITTNSVHNRNMGYAPGTIEHCMLNKVQLQAWGSLAQGRYTGGNAEFEEDVTTAALVTKLAAEYGVSPEAIVLGWLMRHPAGIQPVIGTTNLQRIRQCTEATNVTLSREHWYALLESARGSDVP
ncbi:aldo/keto reductase [Alteromonas sp. 1_MG-2023]|uniref:aldo/keto reductase n=1 Tax=Alteromonas sp. 1_MG-2023 TaxID=3062669 RepID=UPI0026E3D999|nr:aldo/keto reductase [Alteromonas sp. 1_MG-2023]MDO6477724.1 aldo/keto reductase [Alteromonas sp. 1_MG-2023]